MKHIRHLLNDRLKDTNLGREVAISNAIDIVRATLKEILGKTVEQRIETIYIKDGALHITAPNTIFAQELELHKQQLLQPLEERGVKKVIISL
jgi:hypothetical protein